MPYFDPDDFDDDRDDHGPNFFRVDPNMTAQDMVWKASEYDDLQERYDKLEAESIKYQIENQRIGERLFVAEGGAMAVHGCRRCERCAADPPAPCGSLKVRVDRNSSRCLNFVQVALPTEPDALDLLQMASDISIET